MCARLHLGTVVHLVELDGIVLDLEPVEEALHHLEDPTAAGTCPDGLLVAGPAPTVGNTLLFMGLLLWSFLGVAVFADLFMLAIERITSQETTRIITLPNGKTRKVHALVWNATIANLTLMALVSAHTRPRRGVGHALG